ncbi:MAG: serine--tRNA ligase, partial [Steroidobacteraceae bacterium]
MIDPKLLRADPEQVARNLAGRGYRLDVEALRGLEEKRRYWQIESDRLRAARNSHAKVVGQARSRDEDIAPLLQAGEELARQLALADAQLNTVQSALETWQLELPNLLHESVPAGSDEHGNVEIARCGEPRSFAFKPLDHVALAEALGLLDLEAAGR